MVIGLIIVLREILDDELFAVPVSTDLVLVRPLVMAHHLVDLRDDLSAVRLVACLRGIVALRLLLLLAHDVADSLMLVNLHYLGLLL